MPLQWRLCRCDGALLGLWLLADEPVGSARNPTGLSSRLGSHPTANVNANAGTERSSTETMMHCRRQACSRRHPSQVGRGARKRIKSHEGAPEALGGGLVPACYSVKGQWFESVQHASAYGGLPAYRTKSTGVWRVSTLVRQVSGSCEHCFFCTLPLLRAR